jgi:hypothetical protein
MYVCMYVSMSCDVMQCTVRNVMEHRGIQCNATCCVHLRVYVGCMLVCLYACLPVYMSVR